MKKTLIIAFVLGLVVNANAQDDDLMSMLDGEMEAESGSEPVYATFKTSKVINAQTIETVKKKILDFRITHRFGSMGITGAHGLYGFDFSEDIRFSFDYGITNNIQVGVGRSKYNELLDGSFKMKILRQTQDNKMPISLGWYSMAGYTPKVSPKIGDVEVYANFSSRWSYTHQLLIARKFGERLSLILIPTMNHRNVIPNYQNENGDLDQNTIFAIGIGGRFKISKRTAILIDYFHDFSNYRTGAIATNSIENAAPQQYFKALGVGIEIETGGHVFHITLSNNSGIVENNFLPYTTGNWLDGGFKLGFTISRQFSM